jgi:hypothetical protein
MRDRPNNAPPELCVTLDFTCDRTGGRVSYDVPSDAATVKDLWRRRLMLNCPHCHQVHGFAFRPAFIRSALEMHSASRQNERKAEERL